MLIAPPTDSSAPTFLRVVGDVELADRLAVAFEAAVVHFERLQVAEPILAVERGHAIVLGHRTIGVDASSAFVSNSSGISCSLRGSKFVYRMW